MPPKRNTKSPASNVSKRARKVMSLEEKMDIIRRYDQGQRTADIVRATGVSESTLRTIRGSKEKIAASIAQGSSAAAKKTHTVRNPGLNRTEEMLKDWIHKQNHRNIPVTMGIIQTKAKEIYDQVTKDDVESKPFAASSGWFANFKIRHGFHNVKFSGEAASADKPAAEAYIKALYEYIEKHGYRPEQIFNLDETSLYPYRTFDRTYIAEEEKRKPGFKASKQRITILLGTNIVGHKLKPMIIGKSEKPHCFKGVIVENLPVYYYYSNKGWMTSYIWGHYTSFNLENELRNYCREKNIAFKILLLCDNFSGHNQTFSVTSEHVTVLFLPPNTTSLIQPMDQGIIRMFKVNYTRISLQRMVHKIDSDPDTEDRDVVRKYWSSFNLKNAIHVMNEAWQCVSVPCIKGAWRKLCPDLLGDFAGFSVVEEEARLKMELLEHARHVGFDEVDEEEIDNLLTSHDKDVTTEELLQMQKEREEEADREKEGYDDGKEGELKHLTSKKLSKVFACIDEAMQMLEDNDPQQERFSKVQQNVRQSLRCYYDLQKNFRSMAKKKTIETYLTRQPEPSESPEPEPSESPEPQPSETPEPQPSTSRKPSTPGKSRQITLYESLTLKTSFRGFSNSESDDDLPSFEPGDHDSTDE